MVSPRRSSWICPRQRRPHDVGGRRYRRLVVARALDVVFPPRCAGCGDGPWPFCGRCLTALEVLAPPWCERCGRPPRAVERCDDCPPSPVSVARAPFVYAGPARAAIHRLKFSGWRSVAAALADAMVAIDPPAADAVTWVPLARRRLAERGYDQARALAGAVGEQAAPARRSAARDARSRPRRRPGVPAMSVVSRCVARSNRSAGRRRGPASRDPRRRRPDDRVPPPRRAPRRSCAPACARSRCSRRRARSLRSGAVPILERALVRVCGCPGIFPGSRRQPRAKRPT